MSSAWLVLLARDGRVAVWPDGNLIADWQNLRFRDVPTVKIDEIQLRNGGKSSSQQNDKGGDSLVLSTSYIGPVATGAPVTPCDVNASGSTDVVDVQQTVNQALHPAWCGTTDINQDGRCDVVDVQRVVNAALGGGCIAL